MLPINCRTRSRKRDWKSKEPRQQSVSRTNWKGLRRKLVRDGECLNLKRRLAADPLRNRMNSGRPVIAPTLP